MKHQLNNVERALIIKKPHIGRILKGEKKIELRSRVTNIRGRIGLIEQGTGCIVGTCELFDSLWQSEEELRGGFNSHRIDYSENPDLLRYQHAWLLRDVIEFNVPIPYRHPKGAVIWVRSDAWSNNATEIKL